MAVNNSLTQKSVENKVVEYDCNGQIVKLSPNIIRNYLVNGNGAVTDQEVAMFLNLCKYQRLNPFLKEAYLVKYGNQAATIVTGKEALTKRAMHNANYCGQQAGVVVLTHEGNLESRIGTIVLESETLVGGWAKVYVKGYEHPIEISVAYSEYVGLKSSGEVNSQWSKRPATMIRKLALVNIDDVVDLETGRVKKTATKEDLACIQSIKIKPTEFGTEREIKFYDKKGSLELVGKHLGMFKDKAEVEVVLPIFTDEDKLED